MAMNRRALTCAAIGCVVVYMAWSNGGARSNAQPPQSDRLEKLQRKLDSTVRERATLKAVAKQIVASPVNSTIVRMAGDGDRVKKDDIVLELDSSGLQEERDVAKIKLASHEASVSLARRTIERLKKQHGLAASIAKQYPQVIRLKKAALAEARKRGQLSDASAAAQEAEVELSSLQAELSALQLTQSIDDRLAKSEAQLQANLLNVAMSERRLKQLNEKIDACIVRSSSDGFVMHLPQNSRRTPVALIEPGAAVREGQSLLQVFDPAKLQLEVRVHETQIAKVKAQQTVKVLVDALPTQPLKGVVKSVSTVPVAGTWPNTDLKEYTVRVELIDQDQTTRLRAGMTASAEINVSE